MFNRCSTNLHAVEQDVCLLNFQSNGRDRVLSSFQGGQPLVAFSLLLWLISVPVPPWRPLPRSPPTSLSLLVTKDPVVSLYPQGFPFHALRFSLDVPAQYTSPIPLVGPVPLLYQQVTSLAGLLHSKAPLSG